MFVAQQGWHFSLSIYFRTVRTTWTRGTTGATSSVEPKSRCRSSKSYQWNKDNLGTRYRTHSAPAVLLTGDYLALKRCGAIQGIYQVDNGVYGGHKLQPVRYSAWDPDVGYDALAFSAAGDRGAAGAGSPAVPAYEDNIHLKMDL